MQALNKNHACFHQAILMILVLIFTCIQALLPISFNTEIFFFLAITLTIGVFHGMLDIALLKFAPLLQPGFLVVYSALALSALIFLLFFPNVTLVVLLLLSIWHFGEAQRSDDAVQSSSKLQQVFKRFLLGASILSAPYIMANQSLNEVLVTLLPGTIWLAITWAIWGLIAWAWLAAFVVYAMQLLRNKTLLPDYAGLSEILAVWLSFSLLTPLIAFSLYFGAYHAVRHIRDVLSGTNPFQSHKVSLMWVGIITIALLAIITLTLDKQVYIQALQISSAVIVLRASLVLLVAITLPHTLLISIWRNNLYKSL